MGSRLWDGNTPVHGPHDIGNVGGIFARWQPLGLGLGGPHYRTLEDRLGLSNTCFHGPHRHRVLSVAYSPLSTQLASGSEDGDVRLWDVATGMTTDRFRLNRGWVYSVAYSPDGTRLAAGYVDGRIRLWRINTPLNYDTQTPTLPSGVQVSHYPNPAYLEATVVYNLPESGHVRLSVIDVLGREVSLLIDHAHAAGTHEVGLTTSRLPSAMYFLVLQVGESQLTHPITIVR
ncbi:MAG: T9SS type A sorting domain-containing protein [Bacteroidota bacterium]|nr:T9SS type A sorting domain-containing protein [Bacteroidota bacterium]